MSATTLFPAFLKLTGRRVLVVGGGPVAASKLAALKAAGADIVVVAPEMVPEIRTAEAELVKRRFQPTDLDDTWMVVAAAPPEVNRDVAREAAARQLFVNAVDDPPNATVYLGGVVRRGGVTVAISTDGQAPALAGLIRQALEALIPEKEVARWLSTAQEQRRQWMANEVPMDERRPLLLRALAGLYEDRQH